MKTYIVCYETLPLKWSKNIKMRAENINNLRRTLFKEVAKRTNAKTTVVAWVEDDQGRQLGILWSELLNGTTAPGGVWEIIDIEEDEARYYAVDAQGRLGRRL